MGIMLGAMLLVPDFVALDGQKFTIYGFLTTTAHDYSQTVLPVIISIWVMSYVERFFKK